jgi:hypothetical protein
VIERNPLQWKAWDHQSGVNWREELQGFEKGSKHFGQDSDRPTVEGKDERGGAVV